MKDLGTEAQIPTEFIHISYSLYTGGLRAIVTVHLHFDYNLSQRSCAGTPAGSVILALEKFWVWKRCEHSLGPNSQSALDVSGDVADD